MDIGKQAKIKVEERASHSFINNFLMATNTNMQVRIPAKMDGSRKTKVFAENILIKSQQTILCKG